MVFTACFNVVGQEDPSSETIQLDYIINYDYSLEGKTRDDSIKFSLEIIGENYFLGNGKLKYEFKENITDEVILSKLGTLFTEEHLAYFRKHENGEKFTTYFSHREEFLQNTSSSREESIYTIFWLRESNKSNSEIEPYQNYPFYKTEQPYNLYVQKYSPNLTFPQFKKDLTDLRKADQIIEVYYLKQTLEDHLSVKFYYDRNWTILLRTEFFFKDEDNNENYRIKIILQDSNLKFNVLENDLSFWQRYTIEILVVAGLIFLTSIGVLFKSLRHKKEGKERADKQREKSKILDQI